MNKKIKNKTLTRKKVNKFEPGGWKDNWKGDSLGGSITSTLSGVANVATNAIQLAQPGDTSTYDIGLASNQAKIDIVKNQSITASTMDDLNKSISGIDWGNINDLKQSITLEEAGGPSGGDWATGIISGAASGASAGSLIAPPIGTIVGTITGVGAALGGLGFRHSQAKKQQEAYADNVEKQKLEMEQSNTNLKEMIKNKQQEIAQNDLNNFRINNVNAYGGPLFNHTGNWSNGITFIDEGGTHEQNPFEGVMVGVDQEGTPNLVEEGEVIFGDYVFSNRLKPTKKILADGGFSDKYNDWTFAKIAEDLQKESSERPVDFISNNTLEDMMSRLITFQEMVREKKKSNQYKQGGLVNKFDEGTPDKKKPSLYFPEINPWDYGEFIEDDSFTPLDYTKPVVPKMSYFDKKGNEIKTTDPKWNKYYKRFTKKYINDNNSNNLSTIGRYAPVLTNAASLIANAVEKPDKLDYTHFDDAFEYSKNIPTINFTPIGGKLTPDLMDSNYLLNQQLAERRALRRAIRESAPTASTAMMHLANADYNAQRNDAETLATIDRENWARKMQAAQFNLGIDQYNSQGAMSAQQANMNRSQAIANAALQNANARLGIDQFNLASEAQKAQAIASSMGALSEDLSGIGTEAYWRDQIENNPAFMEYIAMMNKARNSAKCGGMLTRKRRK